MVDPQTGGTDRLMSLPDSDLTPGGANSGHPEQVPLPPAGAPIGAAPRMPDGPARRPTKPSGEGRWQRPVGSVEQRGPTTHSAVTEPSTEEHADLAKVAVRSAPPWLVSSLVHMLMVIILGLWFLPVELPRLINLELVGPESAVDGVQIDDHSIAANQDSEAIDIFTPDNLIEVNDPFAAPPALEILPEGTVAASTIDAPEIGLALQGRDEGTKQVLLGKYGGTSATEGAVAAGLAWLAKYQRSDGSWSLKGPYSDGSQFDNAAAATAMALLAFQGAGNTHEKGKYRQNVERGINFLLRLQDERGNFYRSGPLHSGLYSQAQCTIAICELYGMTKDSLLREPAQRAINYCVEVQDKKRGGWRYIPGEDSDLSVTGWFVMALQSAKMAQLEVPSPTLNLVNQFLDSVAHDSGSRYAYIIGGEPKRSMTAEGLLCRQWMGWPQRDDRLQRGADTLVTKENLPRWDDRDVYYWYYATQVLHHLEDDRWETWNHLMRELLPEKQEKKGVETGSWNPTRPKPDAWGFHGGRLYVTCLSIYILEVYYRHLPVYSTDGMQAVAGAQLPPP